MAKKSPPQRPARREFVKKAAYVAPARLVQAHRSGSDQERAARQGQHVSEYTGRLKPPAQPARRRAETGARADV